MKRGESGITLFILPPGWAILFIVVGIFVAMNWLSSSPPSSGLSSPEPNLSEMNGPPTKGALDAPVTILEFADFYCPYCNRHFQQTLPKIDAEYIQKGFVKYSFYNFIVHDEPAQLAAQAGECAHSQGKFWEFHDRLFVVVFQEKQQYLDDAGLEGIAKDVGLDEEVFATCLHSEGAKKEVEKDREKLRELVMQLPENERTAGLGTPAFFINGRLLVGAHPIEKFRMMIEEELAKRRK